MAPPLLYADTPMIAAPTVVEPTTLHPLLAHALHPSAPASIRPVSSSKVSYRVLLLEGDRTSESLLAEAVRAEIPDAEITRAAGALGALALAELYSFDLLIVDATLSQELAAELSQEFLQRNATAEVILCGGNRRKVSIEISEPQPQVHQLSSEVNPLELIETVRGCRDRAAISIAPIDPDDEGYFVVVLSRHTPVEVVQFKCLSGATTALDFIRRDGPGGRVWFARGEIIHAETGALTGEDALIEMINWPGGSIVEVSVQQPPVRTIDDCWSMVLMRAVQAADERKAVAKTG